VLSDEYTATLHKESFVKEMDEMKWERVGELEKVEQKSTGSWMGELSSWSR
jgi:hypothetical protein